MQLLAHATSYEFVTGIVIFLAGVCVGPWIAHFVYGRIKRRRS